MLLNEIEKEENERRRYYSQLQGLSQRLAELPRIDTVRPPDMFYTIVFNVLICVLMKRLSNINIYTEL